MKLEDNMLFLFFSLFLQDNDDELLDKNKYNKYINFFDEIDDDEKESFLNYIIKDLEIDENDTTDEETLELLLDDNDFLKELEIKLLEFRELEKKAEKEFYELTI